MSIMYIGDKRIEDMTREELVQTIERLVADAEYETQEHQRQLAFVYGAGSANSGARRPLAPTWEWLWQI